MKMIMSVKSGSSTTPAQSNGEVIRQGILKKLKTLKKKYFVLRAETPECLARLEYYDEERKFKKNQPPKRSIPLKTCFNINKRTDTKVKHVIALYTKDDCFGIVLENEEELAAWLNDLLKLQHTGVEMPTGQQPKPKWEYVWPVYLCERGLGYTRIGPYRLCLTDKMLTFIKMDEELKIEVPLNSIRGCGNLKNFFYMEIGRSHSLGPGELWLEAEDGNIAFNMHTTVSHRFRICKAQAQNDNQRNQLSDTPNGRIRSSSATEASGNNGGKKNGKNNQNDEDSESTTRFLKASNYVSCVAMKLNNLLLRGSNKRRHSISGAGHSWAANISHQRTQSLPLASPTTSTAPSLPCAPSLTNDHSLAPTTGQSTVTSCVHSQSTCATSTANQSQGVTCHHCPSTRCCGKRVGHNSKTLRERCDSMPSRPRTSSEGNHQGLPICKPFLIPNRSHIRDASHGSPTGSPMSPPSGSTSSSYNSITDDHDGAETHQRLHHYPLTPSDVTIAEEDWPESPRTTVSNSNSFPNQSAYVPMGAAGNQQQNLNNGYTEMSMSPNDRGHLWVSNSESIGSNNSGTPSTDMRFLDYANRLDKVFSYVTTAEDGDDNRPGRAYSVGSKPSQPAIQQTINTDNSRIRAFSVGSKQTKRQHRVLPPTHHPPHGVKSNSAPILTNTRAASSYGSIIDPMDDLMEIDFSNEAIRSRSSTNASGGSGDGKSGHKSSKNMLTHFLESLMGHNKTPPGYVEMNPSNNNNNNKKQPETTPYVDMTQGQKDRTTSEESSYMDMTKAGGGPQPKNTSAYMDMTGSSPVKSDLSVRVTDMSTNNQHSVASEYVDMDPNRRRTDSHNSIGSATGISPGNKWPNPNDYLDMTGGNKKNRHSFSSQISTSPKHFDSMSPKHNSEWMFGPQSSRLQPQQHTDSLEGYVDMTPGNGSNSHPRQSSMDGNNPVSVDYMLMGGGASQKERSKPISIQTTSNNQAIKSSSPITITSLLCGRRLSPTTGTPPNFHLPLSTSTYASLPRMKARKDSGSKDSKDSSSSSVTTPSNSSTMFPLSLNSPSSPGTSKANTPTATVTGSSNRTPASIINIAYKIGDYSKEYAMMDFSKNPPVMCKEDSDYMNFTPGETNKTPKGVAVDDSGYALMQPGGNSADNPQKSTTLPRTGRHSKTSGFLPITSHFAHMDLTDVRSGFRPICEKDERMVSPKPGDQVPQKLNVEPKTETANSTEVEGDYLTQPASSSDYLCMSPTNRKNSNDTTVSKGSNSPKPESSLESRLHYASLDLASTEEAGDNKSPRGVKASSSEVNVNQTATMLYADIDFVKSEDLKKSNSKCSSSISPGLNSSTVIKP